MNLATKVTYLVLLLIAYLTSSAFTSANQTALPLYFSDAWLSETAVLAISSNDKQHIPKHVITDIELNTTNNLYFAAALGKPLLAHLKELNPAANEDHLLKKGNFRFEFVVNNESVYVENLTIGAGSLKQKKEDIVLSKPLFSRNNEDSWGRFLWMRFMHFAGEQSLKIGQNKLTINLSTYIKEDEVQIGKIIASGTVKVNVTKPVATDAEINIQEIEENSGWVVSKASYNKNKIKALNKKIVELDFKDINSIVVIKSGELLIEEYFNGSTRDTLHDPRSVGKSFASSVLGLAIKDGYIKNEKQTIDQYYNLNEFKNYSASKNQITLKQLLTMTSGFDGDDTNYQSTGNEENMYPTDDWVKFTLDLPIKSNNEGQPNWTYLTAGVVLLGDILHRSVPGGLEEYAHENLFKPLSIEEYQWQYTPTGVANTAGGLAMRALDFAKYGQLYKNDGKWGNKQILPKEWVKKSLSALVPRNDDNSGFYGYLFWHDSFPLGNKIIDVAYATGNGGNKIYIFKNIDLVVVINASAYNRPYAHSQVNKIMAEYILPAVM